MIYLLGIGPGDPELVTVKAARILAQSDLVYAPKGAASDYSVAERIIAAHADKENIRLWDVPMGDAQQADAAYAAMAADMAREAAAGRKIAYVTLGDPMVYSTARYLADHLERHGLDYAYVAGIAAYSAAANAAKIELTKRAERFMAAPMPETAEEIVELAALADCVALMKIGRRIRVLLDYVRREKPRSALLVHRLGQAEEEVFDLTTIDELPESVGYLSTALIRKK